MSNKKAPIFKHLSKFDIILISGPQRSGTTICSKMVAQDTGYTLVDEMGFNAHNADHWRQIISDGHNLVVHCPAMCHLLHEWADDERVAVVIMVRDLRDIIASQERIGWTAREEPRELTKYGADYGPIALVKYEYWNRVQRDLFPEDRRFEIEYESLSEHPLWVPREARRHFGYKQTEL